MTRHDVSRLLLVLAFVLAGCGGEGGADPEAPPEQRTGVQEEEDASEPEPERVDELRLGPPEVVAAGLEIPWGVAFLPDGGVLITERPGTVRAVLDGELRMQPVARIDGVVHQGEGGLLGLALDPDFEDNRLAYVYYTAADGNRVSRFTVGDDLAFGDEQPLLQGLPAASNHNGGAVAFGPDGQLYVTVGETGEPALAADQSSPAGAILRLTPEGGIPDDNPHEDSPVWSTGHRNAQGLAWDGEDRLYATDHGPSGEFGLCCADEVNLVEEGGFYGWPNRAGTDDTGDSVAAPGEPIDPVATSGPDETWAPGGIAVHAESRSLLVTNLAGERLLRFTLAEDDPRDVVDSESMLENVGRLRTIVRGPDDCFYVTTSNRDGRGTPADDDDRLLRLCPA
jgi:glucose/arabinose dehydrogenase